MAFSRTLSSKRRLLVNRGRAELLSDIFSALYAGSPRVSVEDTLVARLVAREIDRQKKRVNEINAEFKRLDPRGYQKRLSIRGGEQGLDARLFELRREVADSMHLPLSLFDYSFHGPVLEVTAARSPGSSITSDLDLAARRESGAAALQRLLETPVFVPSKTAKTRLSPSEALRQLLPAFEAADSKPRDPSKKR